MRLGAALGLSLALHLAVLLPFVFERSTVRAGDAAPSPVLVRLASPEQPPAPADPATRGERPRSPGPGLTEQRPDEKRVASSASHRSPAPQAEPGPAPAKRVPYVAMRPASHEVPAEVEKEKLRESQRRVPRSVDLLRPAKLSGALRIPYPADALARGEKGHVVLEVFVGSGGRVDQVVVLDQTGPPALSRVAAESVRKARFRPAEGEGGKQRSRLTLRVDFSYE